MTAIFLPFFVNAQTSLTPEQFTKLTDCMKQFTDAQAGGGGSAMKPSDVAAVTLRCYEQAGIADQLPQDVETTIAGVRDGEARALREGDPAFQAMQALWAQNDALRRGVPELKKKLQETPLTPQEQQRINQCLEKLLPTMLQQVGGTPDAAVHRAASNCFRGTPYEILVTPMYETIATAIDCARDRLGVERLTDAATIGEPITEKERAIITQCYVARTVPITTAAAVVSVLAFGGLRTVALTCYLGFSNVWAVVRRRKSQRVVRVVGALRGAPIDLAIVRLVDKASGATRRSTVSDTNGSCFLSAAPGDYSVQISKPGCTFPAQDQRRSAQDIVDPTITITEQHPVVRGVALVDEAVQELSVRREKIFRWGRRVAAFITWTAPLIAVGAAIASPTLWVIALAALNVALVVLFQIIARHLQTKSLGVVRTPDGKSVANAVVRLFDLQYNKLLAAAVTDERGRYGFAAGAGSYDLAAEKQGVGAHTQRVTVTAASPVVAVDLTLTPAAR